MAGITDLEQLLRSMEPAALEDEYVFVSVTADRARELTYAAMVREDEGISLAMRRPDADAAGLSYDFVAAWITLTVHSDLEAVGLTAAFATALGERGISCNVIAGLHHDHLLVPVERKDDALEALRRLGGSAAGPA
jgi:uncharacterized protein